MPTLAETQALFRHALVTGDSSGVAGSLDGRFQKRIAIHRRNYQSSLVDALLGKFPAVAWLVGIGFVREAAETFVEQCPPQKPCIAEYGEKFPEFLSTRPGAELVPYLQEFAELEWHIGHMAIAIPDRHLAITELSSIDSEKIPELRMSLQHGVRYLRSSWPIDELMKLYVTDCVPDQLEFAPCDVFLEVRGARGAFQINRLQQSEYCFRESLGNGLRIGDSAESAMDVDMLFDAGTALVRLMTDELVTSIVKSGEQGDML